MKLPNSRVEDDDKFNDSSDEISLVTTSSSTDPSSSFQPPRQASTFASENSSSADPLTTSLEPYFHLKSSMPPKTPTPFSLMPSAATSGTKTLSISSRKPASPSYDPALASLPTPVLPQLVDSSTLKKEVAEGADIMVTRERTGGTYSGSPRGFQTDDKGEDFGFNTKIYSKIDRIEFSVARKRRRKLCSVDKANVLGSSMP